MNTFESYILLSVTSKIYSWIWTRWQRNKYLFIGKRKSSRWNVGSSSNLNFSGSEETWCPTSGMQLWLSENSGNEGSVYFSHILGMAFEQHLAPSGDLLVFISPQILDFVVDAPDTHKQIFTMINPYDFQIKYKGTIFLLSVFSLFLLCIFVMRFYL